MARNIAEIQQSILSNIAQDENLNTVLTSTSRVAVYRLISYVVAFSIWTLEVLFDIHKVELTKMLFEQKSGTLPWYRTQALAFQYGFDLLPDSDKFDNGDATPEQIEESKIVKYAAVNESTTSSRVILKIAGENDGVLAPITPDQYEAFAEYVNEYRYAGVNVTVINFLPDRLFLNIRIYRNPLLIDDEGNSILNGGKPVEKAINDYLKALPFNGQFVLQDFATYIKNNVDGVEIVELVGISSSWIDANIGDYGTPQPIYVRAIPESGYYEVVNFDNVVYVV